MKMRRSRPTSQAQVNPHCDRDYWGHVIGPIGLGGMGASQMTYMTSQQVAHNLVSKGEVALRWYDIRWAERILRPIDVADRALGPLGQIFGSYDDGLTCLGLSKSQAAEYGFVSRPDVQTSHVNDVWGHIILSRAALATGAADIECAGLDAHP